MTSSVRSLAESVAKSAVDRGLTVAAAESLTSGRVVSELGRSQGASEWLRGGVVAYSTEVKQAVLGVSPGPVVSARCAEQMAEGVARVTEADIGVSTTGVGGPDSAEGQAPGTVFIGWHFEGRSGSALHRFTGTPAVVVELAVRAALERVHSLLGGDGGDGGEGV